MRSCTKWKIFVGKNEQVKGSYIRPKKKKKKWWNNLISIWKRKMNWPLSCTKHKNEFEIEYTLSGKVKMIQLLKERWHSRLLLTQHLLLLSHLPGSDIATMSLPALASSFFRENIQKTRMMTLRRLKTRREETFMLFHNVVMEFTQEERQLSSHAQRTLYRHVMLQNYSKLVLLGNSVFQTNTSSC